MIPVLRLARRWYSSKRAFSPNGYPYEIITPQPCNYPVRKFDASLQKPHDGQHLTWRNSGTIKTEADLAGIREASRLAASILNELESTIQAGITTEDVDDCVYQLCCIHGCYPSPLDYSGFPKCLTTSVNNVVVHGIPDLRRLREGDIVTLDVTVFYEGYHGDCAKTYPVGECDPDGLKLITVGQLCLLEAIKVCKDGLPLRVIGETIEKTAESHNLRVIPSVCGHGIGRSFHEEPQIEHYRCSESTEIMRENMVFTIEPAICEGDVDVELLEDGWTVVTSDHSRTSQFEHTICVKKENAIILTE